MKTALLAALLLPTIFHAAPAAAQGREERRDEREKEKAPRKAEKKRPHPGNNKEREKRPPAQQRRPTPPTVRPSAPPRARTAPVPRRELQPPASTRVRPIESPRAPQAARREQPAWRAPQPAQRRPPTPAQAAAAARPIASYLPPRRTYAPLPAPVPLTKPKQFVRDWTPPPAPPAGTAGAPAAAAGATPPAQHPAADPATANAIRRQLATENAPNRYYRHDEGGARYIHYMDGERRHWWGFDYGGAYYWSQWHEGRWWWRDPAYGRFVYYRDGYWWWQDPARPQAVYVYMNDGYVPYQTATTLVVEAAPAAAPSAPAAPRSTDVVVGFAPAEPAAPPAPRYSSDADQPGYQAKIDPDRLALVIGVEDYAALPKAQFAARDAAAMAEHLRHLGVADRNLVVLVSSQAARASVAKFVEGWLPDHANEASRVFVYFSGHGAPDPKTGATYLVPWDGDAKYLDVTGYPLKKLYEQLNALPAKEIVVVLDACFSGAGGRSVLPEGARPLVAKADLGRAAAGKVVVLAAAAGDEIAGADAKQGHGLFTYYFLKGLNGEARAGENGTTVQDLYDYLAPNVEDAARRDNRDQTPQLLVPPDGRRRMLIKDPR
jgi:hypothetical protein